MNQGKRWIVALVILAAWNFGCASNLPSVGPAQAEQEREQLPLAVEPLAEVRFASGATDLGAASRAVLDDLAGRLRTSVRAPYLEVQGHADSAGAPEANRRLAAARAAAVRHYLHRTAGLPLTRIGVVILGASAPAADNGTAEGREQNRRVVVVAVLSPP